MSDNEKKYSEENVSGPGYVGANQDYIKELIVSVLLCLAGCLLVICSMRMPSDELTAAPGMFYAAPGLFPMIAGAGMAVLSLILVLKNFIGLKKTVIHFAGGLNKKKCLKLLAAVVLLVIYVFVFLGRIQYFVGTSIYLAATMLLFRNNKTPIWVLLLLSVAIAGLVSYLFGTLARIPLP